MERFEAPRPFAYFGYRDYLRDTFEHRRKTDPGFSHRRFLAAAGIPGSGYLVKVLKASLRLNRKYVPNFCAALGLSGREQQYFEKLVEFGNEKRHEPKQALLKDLLRLRAANPELSLSDKRLKFFKRWYYPVVREVISLTRFRGDFNALARMVVPPITAVQAENAVKFLSKNGFIALEKEGHYSLTEAFITSGDLVNSTMLDQYHRANLALNCEALDLVPPDLRSASSLTLTLSEANFERIRREIRDFRAHLMAISNEDPNPERVFHIGFIALSRSRKKKDGTDAI
ncbi:MAG: hypothetical protein JWP91_172 [Fibrobacteres bacterium]|nr:hypothetical protein [Fibrobacterota bacterium]